MYEIGLFDIYTQITDCKHNNSGPFRVNSQEVVKAPSPIFLKFYSNYHYPNWTWIYHFRDKSLYTLPSWRCLVSQY